MTVNNDHTRPLDTEAFTRLMAAFPPLTPGQTIAVAVSGGADSMALCLLLDQWTTAEGYGLVALTVDHGLRPAAKGEAAQVAQWCAARNIHHHILTWEGPKPTSRVQEMARQRRYQLMGQFCAKAAVPYLAVAHHQQDQAETVLLRLGRGSGVDGLAGMAIQAPLPVMDGCSLPLEQELPQVIRPLLGVAKAQLVALLEAHGQSWIEDPSNENRDYERVRLRQSLDAGTAPLTTQALLALSSRMAGLKTYLQTETEALSAALVTPLEIKGLNIGAVQLDQAGFVTAPREIALRLLRQLLQIAGGGSYPPRFAKVERLYEQIISGDFKGASLGGCLLEPVAQGHIILIYREADALPAPQMLRAGHKMLWDGRLWVACPEEGGEICALASRADAAAVLEAHCAMLTEGERQALPPRRVLMTLPCLCRGAGGGHEGEVVAIGYLYQGPEMNCWPRDGV